MYEMRSIMGYMEAQTLFNQIKLVQTNKLQLFCELFNDVPIHPDFQIWQKGQFLWKMGT